MVCLSPGKKQTGYVHPASNQERLDLPKSHAVKSVEEGYLATLWNIASAAKGTRIFLSRPNLYIFIQAKSNPECIDLSMLTAGRMQEPMQRRLILCMKDGLNR